MDITKAINHIKERFDCRLAKPKYRSKVGMSSCGLCYAASEAIYHMLGGKPSGWVPQQMMHEGVSHWFIKNRYTGEILDLTVNQFSSTPDYSQSRGRGFLTKYPSKTARILMRDFRNE